MSERSPRPDLPITVFVHVHYAEIWEDMCAAIEQRLSIPFHLVITTSQPEQDIVVPRIPACRSVRVINTANQGRDILPFLRAVGDVADFEIGLKLHTKKSPQRADGAEWRAEILNSLLPRGDGLQQLVERLRADPRIGLVAPDGFCLGVKPWVLTNEPGMVSIMSILGVALTEDDLQDAYFAAGSMFWFRRQAITALTSSAVMGLFETEKGQFDGTIAHAMERLFPVEARRRGYVSMAVTALALSRPDMPAEELLDLAGLHADIPNRFFSGPYIAALDVTVRSSRLRAIMERLFLKIGRRQRDTQRSLR